MWLAVILACSTPYAQSCIIFAKQNDLFMTEETCKEDVDVGVVMMQTQGYYAVPACFQVGQNL
tara:strand:+ start:125 stop:313 length:189 start_codon:yes stop_codon:yes gene_type:complete